MKKSIWILFISVLAAASLCRLFLWAAEDVVFDCLGKHRELPQLTTWAFGIRAWLPLFTIPWLVMAVRIARKEKPSADVFYSYASTVVLAIVLLFGLSMVAAILPWMVVVPVLR